MIYIITRLTIITLLNSANAKILDIGGEEKIFSSKKIYFLISIGWFLHLLATVCNIGYYKVHPSEAEFKCHDAKIYVFGKEKDFWYPFKICFKSLKFCSTCACCCEKKGYNNKQQQVESVHLNDNPWRL